MNKDMIFDKIEKMEIREKDYPIILHLLNNSEPKLFLKILEEVLEKNLLWSDFERYLEVYGYSDLLGSNIQRQVEISQILTKLHNLRNLLGLEHPTINKFAVNLTSSDIEISSSFRDDLLYELTKKNPNDNFTAELLKAKLFNSIVNGKVILDNNIPTGELDGITYINGNDILLTINEYILPIDAQYQDLNEYDYQYMMENNISEEMTKKIKSIYNYIKLIKEV